MKEEERGQVECQSQLQADLYHTNQTPISSTMVTIGLVNGMIGGTCLVLPHIGLKTGWIMTFIVCIVCSWMTYYTAYLIVLHLGKGTQIRDCILNHFNNDYKYMRGYSFIIWLSFMPYMLIYFRIICLQIEGLLGHHSDLIGPFVALALIILVVLVRIYHMAEETLAYGIISIVGYILFLIWAQFSAPSGPKTVKTMGQPVTLAASLLMAFMIHDFLVNNIVKNPHRDQYHGTVRKTFFIGTTAYLFVCYGCFAIANRKPFKEHPETVNDYFGVGEWQNSLIEVVYMIHMISAFPNFLIISKLRFFQMFNIEVLHKIHWKEALFIVVVILISYLVYLSGVHLEVMITLNGSVMGYSYVIVIPIWIHFKCVFWDRSSGYIEDDPQWNSKIVPNQCQCDNVYKNKFMLYLQTVFLVLVLIAGMGLIVFTISNVAKETYKNSG